MESTTDGPRAYPFKPQLALALALIRLKPTGKLVKEYILEIRKNIKATTKSEFLLQEKFFDSVAFWQRAYESSEAEQAKLLNKIHDLEQRNQDLLAKLQMDPSTSKGRLALSSKTTTLMNKKSQESRGSIRQFKVPSQGPAVGKNKKENEAEGSATKLMRQLFVLQRALQKKQPGSYLANEAVLLCKEAEGELLLAVQRQKIAANPTPDSRSDEDEEPTLITVIKSVEMSFCLAHGALRKIENREDNETPKSQIVYYLVCLFESTMTALAQYCADISIRGDQETPGLERTSATAKARRHEKKRSSRSNQNSKAMTAEQLLNLLCTMALALDLTQQDDVKVMEGILYIVLNRMGRLLALFNFEDLQIPATCPEMSRPNGLVAMEQEVSSSRSVQLEAKHLISFLERILSRSSILTPENEAAQPQFFNKVKARLQRTLLKAVFGGNEPLFQEGLRSPATPPPQDATSAPLEQVSFSDWLTQELWRLVGWDLLSSMTSGG